MSTKTVTHAKAPTPAPYTPVIHPVVKPPTPVPGRDAPLPAVETQLATAARLGYHFGPLALGPGTTTVLQPKLRLGPVSDPYEQEADRTAAAVVQRLNAPDAAVQRQPEGEEDEAIQPKLMVQRQATPPEEDELQRQAAPEEDDEQVQTKLLLQRQSEPEEEEQLQTKALIQRQPMPEEDEEAIQRQTMPDEDEEAIERQTMPEEDDELVQIQSLLQRQPMPEEDEEEVQRTPAIQTVRPNVGRDTVDPPLERSIQSVRGGGQPLAAAVRKPLEQHFGADFSQVKIHTDGRADTLNRSLQARAFTTGQDLFFRAGEYNPQSTAGQQLLAHELTHVLQQAASNSHKPNTKASVAHFASPELQSWPVQKQPQSPTAVSSRAKWENLPEQKEFLERVLQAHIQRSQKRRKEPLPDLSGAELGPVLGTRVEMRKDAANAASKLIAAANQDLAAAKAALDQDALKTLRISATSGYRGRSHQENLWRQYFTRSKGYYNRTSAKRAKLPGGEHGDGAVSYMVGYISGKIAPPGFSNHQAGLAIDLLQIRTKGNEISNSTDAAAVERWQSTWFFRWLQNHAATFQFEEYGKEPWHWTYRGQNTASGGVTGAAGNTPAVSNKTPTRVETPLQTTSSVSGNEQTWVEKAVKQNHSVGQTLGWATRIDEIVAHFQQLGLLPPLQTPGSEGFAEAVKQYQTIRPPLGQDGVLGRNTWRQLSIEIGNTTGSSSQTDRKQEGTSSNLTGAPWIPIAKAEIGMKEIKGTKHNPRVVEYLQTTGKWWSTDETPWCSGFVNWVMAQFGIAGTGSAKAISWLTWGRKIEKPAYGAIGVISYGGGKGHVGFVVGKQGNNILLLGGNQSDQVKISAFASSKFSAFVFPAEYEVHASAFELEESDRSYGKEAGFETTR